MGGSGELAVVVRTDGREDVLRSFSLSQRRALYWRLTTGGENQQEAAEIAGVTDRQVRRWLRRPDFRRAWDDPESWSKVEVRRQRAGLEHKALAALHVTIDNPETPPTVLVDAASKALTDIRQARQSEQAPAAGLSVYLVQLRERSAAILADASDEADEAVDGEAREIS